MEAVADRRRVARAGRRTPGRSRCGGSASTGTCRRRARRPRPPAHPVDDGPAAVERQQRLVVGVGGPDDRRRQALFPVGPDQQVLAGDLVPRVLPEGVAQRRGLQHRQPAGGVWYADAELMNTYWPIRPDSTSSRDCTSRGVKARKSATTSNSRSPRASRTEAASFRSPTRLVAPVGCRPRGGGATAVQREDLHAELERPGRAGRADDPRSA